VNLFGEKSNFRENKMADSDTPKAGDVRHRRISFVPDDKENRGESVNKANSYSPVKKARQQNTSFLHNFSLNSFTQALAGNATNNFAEQSKAFVQDKIESVCNEGKFSSYFAIDLEYILQKLKMLIFPFKKTLYPLCKDVHSLPKINKEVPDCYIPLMSFLTFIILSIALRGFYIEHAFDGFFISILHHIAFFTLEFALYCSLLGTFTKDNTVNYLDFVAILGYRYFSLTICLLIKSFFSQILSFITIPLISLGYGYFLVKSLKSMLYGDNILSNINLPGGSKVHYQVFFALFALQPIIFWLYLGYATGFF